MRSPAALRTPPPESRPSRRPVLQGRVVLTRAEAQTAARLLRVLQREILVSIKSYQIHGAAHQPREVNDAHRDLQAAAELVKKLTGAKS
jgi:hypothetical protein